MDVGIRARLTIGMVVLLLIGFGVLGVVVVSTTRAALIDQVDARIRAATLRMDSRGGPPGRDAYRDDDHGRDYPDAPYPQSPERGDDDGRGRDGDQRTARDVDDIIDAERMATPILVEGTPVPADDPYEHPIARLEYAPDGDLLDADPSGYPDTPDPLPAVPAWALAQDEGRIITLASPDGTVAYRALIERRGDGDIVVTAAPLSDVEDAVTQVMRAVALTALATLAITVLASWWLIRAGLRPVDRMIDTAAAIAGGALSRRVPDANPRTELGRLGAALNEMLTQLERSAAARVASEARLRRFVADAAHELMTPLTSLRGYAELYRQGALPTADAVDRAMGRMEAEASRMGRLVDDLLLLARLDQQRALEMEPVDLVSLAREAAADFTAVAPDRPFTLQVEDDVVVLGDQVRLRQVIDNLLTNARIHTAADAPVHLSVRRREHDAEMIVADEGPGISQDAQEHVFERFWRADPGRTRARGGTGLGLAIVASIVAAHSGTIDLTSTPGRGSTFTIRIPLANLTQTSLHGRSTG